MNNILPKGGEDKGAMVWDPQAADTERDISIWYIVHEINPMEEKREKLDWVDGEVQL
jgi:hypothetical protein